MCYFFYCETQIFTSLTNVVYFTNELKKMYYCQCQMFFSLLFWYIDVFFIQHTLNSLVSGNVYTAFLEKLELISSIPNRRIHCMIVANKKKKVVVCQ